MYGCEQKELQEKSSLSDPSTRKRDPYERKTMEEIPCLKTQPIGGRLETELNWVRF